MQRAKATILDAAGTAGSTAGYQMVELTMEVKPKDGMPFQVKRKVSAGKLGPHRGGAQARRRLRPGQPAAVELRLARPGVAATCGGRAARRRGSP